MKNKIILTAVLLTTLLSAQQSYELTPGVKGNQLILQLANISPTQSIDNVEVKLITESANISFDLTEAKIKNLNISEEKEVSFSFDVNYNIDITKKDTVEFLITDNHTIHLTKQFIFTYTQPKEYRLEQNYPNPFNPSTKIRYAIPLLRGDERGVSVSLKVYDILGNEVATLVNEQKEAGYYEIDFNASSMASGVYIYRLVSGKFVSTKKMMVLR